MGEIWKDIEGYEGIYQVSNLGKVKSLERYCSTHWGRRRVPEKILNPQEKEYGYLCVDLHRDGNSKSYSIHRLVATAFIPNPEDKPEVNHKDGDTGNNQVSNLEWATGSENVRHALQTGLISKQQFERFLHLGTAAVSKKVICLNTHQIFNSIAEASREFNVSSTTIYNCIHHKYNCKKLSGIELAYYRD